MAIKYRLENQNEEQDYLSFRIYGPDTVDATVREAIVETTVSEWGTAADWLAANQTEAQTLIDAGEGGTAFTVFQEAKNFVTDNPAAIQLLELGPDDLESAIENRTANQETLLIKTLSFAVRVFYAERGEE